MADFSTSQVMAGCTSVAHCLEFLLHDLVGTLKLLGHMLNDHADYFRPPLLFLLLFDAEEG
jgi:hypothetical protein